MRSPLTSPARTVTAKPSSLTRPVNRETSPNSIAQPLASFFSRLPEPSLNTCAIPRTCQGVQSPLSIPSHSSLNFILPSLTSFLLITYLIFYSVSPSLPHAALVQLPSSSPAPRVNKVLSVNFTRPCLPFLSITCLVLPNPPLTPFPPRRPVPSHHAMQVPLNKVPGIG